MYVTNNNLRNKSSNLKSNTSRKHLSNISNTNNQKNSKLLYSSETEFISLPAKNIFLKELEASTSSGIYSQRDTCDTIFLISGSHLNVRIAGKGLRKIRYRDCDNPTGTVTSIPKSEILSIRYASEDQKDTSGKNKVKRKLDPVGIAGFILSIAGLPFLGSLSFALITLILTGCLLGWISSNRIKRHPDKLKGKGLAEISIVLGYALLIFLILFVLIVLISKIF
jgi:hypothetical protein